MKEYNKPYINDEEIELEDIIAKSKDINDADEKNPFSNVGVN